MAQTAKAELMLYQPNMPPVRLPIPTSLATLGRAADCTIPIKDRFLSRRHAEIAHIDGGWILRDCGSANGTFVNGVRVQGQAALRPGDRISLGDSEIIFQESSPQSDTTINFGDAPLATNISIPVQKVVEDDRSRILTSLALELLEDRPMSELFEFILDRVMKIINPSRAALALLADDKKSFITVKLRRRDTSDSMELTISRTLLAEVVEEKRVLSFIDVAENEKLGQALSIIGQSIRSALCAPLLVGDSVLGVLYADFLMNQTKISEDDVRLMAQIARFAAVKLETTRLREEALVKQKMDEELKTTYVIQSRLLPSAPPTVHGYTLAGVNRPAKTVSGDYYDFIVRDNGRIYFVIADVSGKGITAALVMASLATAFSIFARRDPTPAELLRELNVTLTPKLSPTKFVTMFAGFLDPSTGRIDYANAGHVPPLWVSADGVTELRSTDMVLGLMASASYRDQTFTLNPGDSLVLFTDGITEAENSEGLELGAQSAAQFVKPLYGAEAGDILRTLEDAVILYTGGVPLGDDVTILAVSRKKT